jgi:hypothetical protein
MTHHHPRRQSVLLILLPILALASIHSIANADVTSTSYINLLDGPYNQRTTSPHTTVYTSASASSASASATANTDIFFTSHAYSENMGLSERSTGAAGCSLYYNLIGNSTNALLPLTFNFSISGSLTAKSEGGNLGSISLGSLIYSVQTTSTSTGATYNLESQGGAVIPQTSGTSWNGNITPMVSVNASIGGTLYALNDSILSRLGINPGITSSLTFGVDDQGIYSSLQTQISSSIFNFGLPEYNLPAGLISKIGFDVTYLFDGFVTITTQVKSIDSLILLLQSSASSSSNASASSDFTLTLNSVTVPEGLNVNTSGMYVNFESGMSSMPITVASSVPIPAPFWLLGSGLVALIGLRRKYLG